jgi:hypothetical protein
LPPPSVILRPCCGRIASAAAACFSRTFVSTDDDGTCGRNKHKRNSHTVSSRNDSKHGPPSSELLRGGRSGTAEQGAPEFPVRPRHPTHSFPQSAPSSSSKNVSGAGKRGGDKGVGRPCHAEQQLTLIFMMTCLLEPPALSLPSSPCLPCPPTIHKAVSSPPSLRPSDPSVVE